MRLVIVEKPSVARFPVQTDALKDTLEGTHSPDGL